jgi:hypothetical protein
MAYQANPSTLPYPIITILQREIARLKTSKNPLRVILPLNLHQTLLILLSIATENILCFIRIILVNEAMMDAHFLRECYGSIHDFVAGFLYSGIVDGFVPADGVAYHFKTMRKTHVMCKVEEDLRSRGPSLSVIPKAFPPFL